MIKSSKPIISHIPDFLSYCRKIRLSDHTQENYKRYLEKFILWLKKTKKENLKIHKLMAEDVLNYKIFLSRFQDKKGHFLKTVTQNYYLIALKALLSYFTVKDIVWLLKDIKIELKV